jgi:YggT family protein
VSGEGEREAQMSTALEVVQIALYCFLFVLIFRLVMDYVFQFARSWQPGKAMVVVLEATYTVTDPPLKLLRRFIPPLRFGGVALDLSFFVLMIIVYILINVVARL